jgi:hypothetical protein
LAVGGAEVCFEEARVATLVSEGTFFGGDTYSAYLAVDQVGGYTVNLLANTTYYLDVLDESTPLDLAVVNSSGVIVDEGAGYLAGQMASYTPTITGSYALGLDTSSGISGSYTVTGGNAWVNLTDTSTGASSNPFMTPYSGPVPALTEQFINLSPDNLNIARCSP